MKCKEFIMNMLPFLVYHEGYGLFSSKTMTPITQGFPKGQEVAGNLKLVIVDAI